MSGTTPKCSTAPPAATVSPVFTSSKIRTMPWLRGELADRLQVARLGEDDPEVHHRRLHDHAGRQAALGGEPVDPPLHRLGVVERHGDGEVDDRLRDPGAVRAARRGRRGRRSGRTRRRSRPSPRRGGRGTSRRSSRSSRGRSARARSGSRPSSPPSRSSCTATSAAGSAGRAPRRRRSRPRSAPRSACRARPARGSAAVDDRVRVPLRHRAEAVVEVDVLVAVDVPDALALAAVEVDRPRIAQLVRRGDAAGERAAGPLPHRPRARRPLVQPRRPRARSARGRGPVDLDRGADRRHSRCSVGTTSTGSGERWTSRSTTEPRIAPVTGFSPTVPTTIALAPTSCATSISTSAGLPGTSRDSTSTPAASRSATARPTA